MPIFWGMESYRDRSDLPGALRTAQRWVGPAALGPIPPVVGRSWSRIAQLILAQATPTTAKLQHLCNGQRRGILKHGQPKQPAARVNPDRRAAIAPLRGSSLRCTAPSAWCVRSNGRPRGRATPGSARPARFGRARETRPWRQPPSRGRQAKRNRRDPRWQRAKRNNFLRVAGTREICLCSR